MLKHNIIASKLKVIVKTKIPLMVQIVLFKQIMLFRAIFKHRFRLSSKGILNLSRNKQHNILIQFPCLHPFTYMDDKAEPLTV
jgi:hypothetical protein